MRLCTQLCVKRWHQLRAEAGEIMPEPTELLGQIDVSLGYALKHLQVACLCCCCACACLLLPPS